MAITFFPFKDGTGVAVGPVGSVMMKSMSDADKAAATATLVRACADQ